MSAKGTPFYTCAECLWTGELKHFAEKLFEMVWREKHQRFDVFVVAKCKCGNIVTWVHETIEGNKKGIKK